MDNDFQLTFDFDINKDNFIVNDLISKQIPEAGNPKQLSFKDMRRAALGWLISQNPSGVGANVPTRISRFPSDLAAFWSKPIRRNGQKILYPVKTAIIEVRHDRELCWQECAGKDELLGALKVERANKHLLEVSIRKNEPELKLDDNLFPEYESWDYSKSTDKEYQKCRSKVKEFEYALYNGSRFEKIRRASLADYLYLAVPTDSVHPYEVAGGWGLLYINKNLEVKLVKEPELWDCPIENKFHLVQNISSASLKNTLFTNGINMSKEGKLTFVRLPRRRRC